MEILEKFLENISRNATVMETVNKVVEHYDNKDVLFGYYSRERVLSERAKREWVEPDLRPLGSNENTRSLHSASLRSG
jgi:hypothetical protein